MNCVRLWSRSSSGNTIGSLPILLTSHRAHQVRHHPCPVLVRASLRPLRSNLLRSCARSARALVRHPGGDRRRNSAASRSPRSSPAASGCSPAAPSAAIRPPSGSRSCCFLVSISHHLRGHEPAAKVETGPAPSAGLTVLLTWAIWRRARCSATGSISSPSSPLPILARWFALRSRA